MGHAVCRIGDTGSGLCHLHGANPVAYTTTFYEGSPTFTADGIAVVRVGDHGHASCGHTTIAISFSGVDDADGKGIHRVGDTGYIVGSSISTYTAMTGSPTTDMG